CRKHQKRRLDQSARILSIAKRTFRNRICQVFPDLGSSPTHWRANYDNISSLQSAFRSLVFSRQRVMLTTSGTNCPQERCSSPTLLSWVGVARLKAYQRLGPSTSGQ